MKSLQEMIEVMEASKTKEIESCSLKCGEFRDWKECEKPGWNWVGFDYRVKAQEPRRLVGLENDKHPLIAAYPDLNSAAMHFAGVYLDAAGQSVNKIEFIELTPDVKSRLGLP